MRKRIRRKKILLAKWRRRSVDCKQNVTSAALLVTYGRRREKNKGATVESYYALIDFLRWQDRGVITVGNVMEKGAMDGNPALQQAEELGKSI